MFYFKKLMTAVILPPTGPLLLVGLGLLLAMQYRWRRRGFLLAAAGSLGLLALSTPLVAFHLTRIVSDTQVLDPTQLRSAQAIVIPSCGVRRNAIEYGTDVPSGMSMDRIRYGASLARRSALPVLITGGRVYGAGRAEADVMREVLERDFRIPVRWVEEASRNTYENAVFSASVLKEAGISRVVVVTHAVDARRVRREFEATGLQVTVAPTMIPGGGKADHWVQHMPSASALQGSTLALYEILGNLATTLGLGGG